MIDFQPSQKALKVKKAAHDAAEYVRSITRYYDDHEHEELKDEEIEKIRYYDGALKKALADPEPGDGMFMLMMIEREEGSWGDPMLSKAASNIGLGNAAIKAVATPEQKERFEKFYTAMAITEPGCGSDTAAVTTTATLDTETNEWILNGEKIFVTAGKRCEAVVVWATVDKSKGRAAIKSFVVEKGRPGMTVTKLEHKLGIRASDTASIVFENCRIPFDNILGSPEVKERVGGQKGVMATFDATRPSVASMAIGVARAAIDFTKEKLEEEGYTFPYGLGRHSLSAVQKEMLDMEANLEVARLLVWQSATLLDKRLRNSLEASMGKAKAGRVATLICQKCVALLGPLGYSRELLVEKWMRDCKINDIFEGTGQIQMLIICRHILGFSRDQLK
ncbi:MAG: acyl-CoA dehydrogenase family protein [Desulfobulbaceae bacterium]|nr:acyl-CoA dehydrogenase family protein [Desulfobulbaceae bacterium]